MITTVDGVTKKRGDKAWQVGLSYYSANNCAYEPTLAKMTGQEKDTSASGHPTYWHDFHLCQEQCNLMNQDLTK